MQWRTIEVVSIIHSRIGLLLDIAQTTITDTLIFSAIAPEVSVSIHLDKPLISRISVLVIVPMIQLTI